MKGLYSPFRIGEKIYYSCDQCYKLKGPANRQCQADERWTDTQPTCERKYMYRITFGVFYAGEISPGQTGRFSSKAMFVISNLYTFKAHFIIIIFIFNQDTHITTDSVFQWGPAIIK